MSQSIPLHSRSVIDSVPCDFVSHGFVAKQLSSWLNSTDFHHIVTLNPEMVVHAHTDLEFKKIISKAALRIPDGSGLFWAKNTNQYSTALNFLRLTMHPFKRYETITGHDITYQTCLLAQQQQVPIFLLGSTATRAKHAAQVLRKRFPKLIIHALGGVEHHHNGPPHVIERIRESRAQILLVAFGAPNQEKWIASNQARLPHVKIAAGIGGVLDVLSGSLSPSPYLIQKSNLEWAWRLLQQPQRLPRIWRATITFTHLVTSAQKQTNTYKERTSQKRTFSTKMPY